MSDEIPRDRLTEYRDAKRRQVSQGISDWLDDVAETVDEEDLRDADGDAPWNGRRTGVDRYRAWQDFYDMRKTPSGRWETTCRKCGASYVRGDSVAANGCVYKTSSERVMDLVETHIIRGCDQYVTDSADVLELPIDPPF